MFTICNGADLEGNGWHWEVKLFIERRHHKVALRYHKMLKVYIWIQCSFLNTVRDLSRFTAKPLQYTLHSNHITIHPFNTIYHTSLITIQASYFSLIWPSGPIQSISCDFHGGQVVPIFVNSL